MRRQGVEGGRRGRGQGPVVPGLSPVPRLSAAPGMQALSRHQPAYRPTRTHPSPTPAPLRRLHASCRNTQVGTAASTKMKPASRVPNAASQPLHISWPSSQAASEHCQIVSTTKYSAIISKFTPLKPLTRHGVAVEGVTLRGDAGVTATHPIWSPLI